MLCSLFLAVYILSPIGPSPLSQSPSNEAVLIKPSCHHVLNSKHIFLDTVELEDQSKWTVAPPDAYKLVAWEIGDTVILSPHFSLFSIYKFQYYLTNATRSSYVRVNLFKHPCDYQPKSRWVTSLDIFGGRLFLNDGSSWKICSEDAALFQNWSINDFVIYGHYDMPLTSYPFILINARLNHSIRAVEF